ncbi:MAG: bifunctional hydroxymethylpyrimidine kinase/phosphomethylpyrimidine kinase [Hyphomicrobium sp.]|uniref:bifunctional hydroxymethylpyrimidine kinase/phosphomethylpyrimidine kinase n=1 Tax=Hyphomicrobium sp. TaxID=82 RepID=UPI0025B9CF19|nr:bifunctional hydroxymethylpyrimidine kinase/phosphomethylpyrimidine kinase [Hyphomicrobium sp.]MBX9864875.1 bifunctional hydroxymethylpyrimidine kinase/phosphomethylpyrimidine kinase [Hyphomicrobium sp.]
MKGGHGDGAEAVDWLLRPDAPPLRFAVPCKPGTRRGTGCTLASAIAAHLARGDDLASPCGHAKHYLWKWI